MKCINRLVVVSYTYPVLGADQFSFDQVPSTESFNIESGALLSLPTILFMVSINVMGKFALLRLLFKPHFMSIHQMVISTI